MWIVCVRGTLPSLERMVEFFAGFPHTFFSIVRKAAGSSTLPGRELFDFLTCKSLFDAGRRIVWIDPTNDRDTMKAAQNAVRKELADGAIAVEVNPPSNMLVGNLTELDHHPLWKLRPPQSTLGEPKPPHRRATATGHDGSAPQSSTESSEPPPLTLCVGSDDPVIFATDTRREYLRLYDALVVSGLGHESALRWVYDVRDSGFAHRFTFSNAGRTATRSDSSGGYL